MYTCLGGEKGVGKGEEKVDTIHLLSQCCFRGNRMFGTSLCVEFLDLIMKIGGVVNHVLSFPNCPLLPDLKL
jgi:hypothetical protein